jgi:hypothetical protein|tara:strand:- start:1539 stop:1769 length:231 start_codon:yes stop_codon:yes gene_type:complete
MTKTKTKPVEATEVKETKTPEELMQEAAAQKEEHRRLCGEEIDTILKKYNCDLTAQMLLTERGAVPQVFIIDARQS